jgi:(2Fe-2S) ferredoxin
MEQGRVPYQKILFVCVNQREPHETCCAHRESEAIAAALKARVKALGLSHSVRVSKSGCQDLCAKGPNVMVFPDYVWYHSVTPGDVERIIQDTIRGLQLNPAPDASCV